ncbi:MAG: hypothetical protein IAE84_10500 [Saprospiraceae bacterium]|nr:hypothetical protein [Saprospiraceae bacterium]HRF39238.1 hypothetical protein [Saprospiraceae bacterium]HRK82264.1 hypothetical protein [Saprospiraceae bacterium]
MAAAIFFCYRPLLSGLENIWADYNKGLVFLGLGVSFSTLQDTTKTQNKLSKRIWENPRYARIFLIFLSFLIVVFIGMGLVGMFLTDIQALQELSFGFLIFSIGMLGMLKAAVEMAENHGNHAR